MMKVNKTLTQNNLAMYAPGEEIDIPLWSMMEKRFIPVVVQLLAEVATWDTLE